MTDVKRAAERLSKIDYWEDAGFTDAVRKFMKEHREALEPLFEPTLPRLQGAKTPEAAWKYLVDLERAWKQWARQAKEQTAILVEARQDQIMLDPGRPIFTVSAVGRRTAAQLWTSDPSVGAPDGTGGFFKKKLAAWFPFKDLKAAAALLSKPHDVKAARSTLFAEVRPPRSASSNEHTTWLLTRYDLGQASKAERAQVDAIALERLQRITPVAVEPRGGTDEQAWSRWVRNADRAIERMFLPVQDQILVYVGIDGIASYVDIKIGVQLVGADEDHIVELHGSKRAIAAVEELLAGCGITKARLMTAAKRLQKRTPWSRLNYLQRWEGDG